MREGSSEGRRWSPGLSAQEEAPTGRVEAGQPSAPAGKPVGVAEVGDEVWAVGRATLVHSAIAQGTFTNPSLRFHPRPLGYGIR